MRTTLGLWLGLSLGSAGCLISGYDERSARVEDAAQRPDAPEPSGTDAGTQPDIDAGESDALDAGAPSLMDAQLDLPDDDGGRSDLEAWCATHPCGDVKPCSGPACELVCSAEAPTSDAGRTPVDCTFDCDGAERCDTTRQRSAARGLASAPSLRTTACPARARFTAQIRAATAPSSASALRVPVPAGGAASSRKSARACLAPLRRRRHQQSHAI